MARPRAKRVAAATADAAPDGKKTKQRGFVMTLTVPAPDDVSPVTLKLDAVNESIRAARTAKAAATEKLHIKDKSEESFELFAKPFALAVASVCANDEEPVSWTKVITTIAETGLELKIGKQIGGEFAWRGFSRGRWVISRDVAKKGLVAFPKGHATCPGGNTRKWRFSPSPAARRPLAKLSK